jgi:hypothetical protein
MTTALTLGSPWKQWTWIPSAKGLMASQVFRFFRFSGFKAPTVV